MGRNGSSLKAWLQKIANGFVIFQVWEWSRAALTNVLKSEAFRRLLLSLDRQLTS